MFDIETCRINRLGECYVGEQAISAKGSYKFKLVFTFLSSEANENMSVVVYSLHMYGDSIVQRHLLSF